MRLKMRAAAVAILALLVGALATPAWAQVEGEPASLEDCFIAFQESGFEGFLPGDVDTAEEFGLWLEDEKDLSYEEVCEIGGTYVSDVAGEIITQPPPDREVVLPVTQPVDPPAPKVLGQVLAVTGIDAAILTLVGLSLVGLGVVAVRGTRRRPSES